MNRPHAEEEDIERLAMAKPGQEVGSSRWMNDRKQPREHENQTIQNFEERSNSLWKTNILESVLGTPLIGV